MVVRYEAAHFARAVLGLALVFPAALPGTAAATGASRIFTIAGVSSPALHPCGPVSSSCGTPTRPAAAWPATQRHISGACLTALPDGTILLCNSSELLALSADGLMRHWPGGTNVGQVLNGDLLDADAAPDGSVMVIAEGARVGDGGVARVRADGSVQRLVAMQIYGPSGIAALPDGGAWVAGSGRPLVRFDAAGNVIRRIRGSFSDVAALPDGSIVAATVRGRVVRLKGDDRMAVVAGGGRGFKNGAKGTDVNLGEVWAVAALRGSAILIGATRGLLRLDRDGRIQTVVRGGADACDCAAVDDARAANDDGRYVRDVRLTQISRVAALDRSQLLALTAVPRGEQVSTARLALVAPIDRIDRLALALPRRNRALLRQGRVEIVSTKPAMARVELFRGRHVVASKNVSLRRGGSRIRLRVKRSSTAHVLRVVATTATGATATHQLAVIPRQVLPRPVVTRIEDAISVLGTGAETDAWVGCRRRTWRRYGCVIHWVGEGERTSPGVLSLRDDGLISFRGPRIGPRDDPHVRAINLVFEPLTYNPRPN